jgi:Skp family chaperone for outer membrane proteins
MSIAWKKTLLVLSVIGVVLLGVVLLVSGQWKALERMILQLGIKKRKIELDKLDSEQSKRSDELAKDDLKVKELEDKRKQLQKDNTISEFRIKGLTHEEIVAELRTRGL